MDYRACIFKLVYHFIKIFCFKMVEDMANLMSSLSMCLLPHFLNSEVGPWTEAVFHVISLRWLRNDRIVGPGMMVLAEELYVGKANS